MRRAGSSRITSYLRCIVHVYGVGWYGKVARYAEKCAASDTAVVMDVGPGLRPGGQDRGVCHCDTKQAMCEVKSGLVETGLIRPVAIADLVCS